MDKINGFEIVDKIVKGEIRIDIDDSDFPFNKAILSRESLVKQGISLDNINYDVFCEEEVSDDIYNFITRDEYILIGEASKIIFNSYDYTVTHSEFDMTDGLNLAWAYFVADLTKYWEHCESVFMIPPQNSKLDEMIRSYINQGKKNKVIEPFCNNKNKEGK